MDYRHTEDFARQIERAALRAHAARDEAIDEWVRAAGRVLREAAVAAWQRLLRSTRRTIVPEA